MPRPLFMVKTMDSIHELRAALERCEQRVKYCEQQFERFDVDSDDDDERATRLRRKLKDDWELAVRDAEHVREQLGRAQDG